MQIWHLIEALTDRGDNEETKTHKYNTHPFLNTDFMPSRGSDLQIKSIQCNLILTLGLQLVKYSSLLLKSTSSSCLLLQL